MGSSSPSPEADKNDEDHDLARQVNKALNWKSITLEQELKDALDEMARDIAFIEPDPQEWVWWVR